MGKNWFSFEDIDWNFKWNSAYYEVERKKDKNWNYFYEIKELFFEEKKKIEDWTT